MKKALLLISFLSCIFSTNAQERRLALVIGNGNYTMSILANPENDAKSMEETLKSVGFEVMKYENLGQKEMRQAIDDFGSRLVKFDMGLFFYAGHGIQANGFNYLIPVDASLKSESDVEYNCVRADRVLGKMENARNGVNFVILDACRDNPFERSWTRAAKGRGFAHMNAPVGSVVAFATSPGNTASDGVGGHTPYTSGLIKYLPEPGLTAIQMFQNVTAYVQEVSTGTQLPWVSTSLTGDVYFVKGSSGVVNPVAAGSIVTQTGIREEIAPRSKMETSIAVLPFHNYMGDEGQDWLVASQHETLITELSKISQFKSLRVIYRGSVNAIRKYDMSISEIAKKVDVDYVVEGSVMRFADSIMLHLRLIQALPDEKLIWAQSYTSDVINILRLHHDIADEITGNM